MLSRQKTKKKNPSKCILLISFKSKVAVNTACNVTRTVIQSTNNTKQKITKPTLIDWNIDYRYCPWRKKYQYEYPLVTWGYNKRWASITIGREEEKGVVLNTVEAAVYSLQKPHRKQFIQILNIMETLT